MNSRSANSSLPIVEMLEWGGRCEIPNEGRMKLRRDGWRGKRSWKKVRGYPGTPLKGVVGRVSGNILKKRVAKRIREKNKRGTWKNFHKKGS